MRWAAGLLSAWPLYYSTCGYPVLLGKDLSSWDLLHDRTARGHTSGVLEIQHIQTDSKSWRRGASGISETNKTTAQKNWVLKKFANYLIKTQTEQALGTAKSSLSRTLAMHLKMPYPLLRWGLWCPTRSTWRPSTDKFSRKICLSIQERSAVSGGVLRRLNALSWLGWPGWKCMKKLNWFYESI